MIEATKDVSAWIDGRSYRFKKGEAVDAPANVVERLVAARAAKESKENKND